MLNTTKTRVAGIYKLTNLSNERFYVGSAINLSVRKKQHFWHLKSNRHPNKFLQHDFNKCGEQFFVFEILEYVQTLTDLTDIEQRYLNECFDNTQTCYNICPVAYSRLGTTHSNEAKKKMSNAWSVERKKKLIKQSRELGLYSMAKEKNPFYGKRHSEEAKRKISKAQKGRKLSEAHKAKIQKTFFIKYGGAPNKGKRKTAIEKYKGMLAQKHRKRIVAINIDTGETEHFNSIREASTSLKLVARHQISLILREPYRKNGCHRRYKNWRFEYDK